MTPHQEIKLGKLNLIWVFALGFACVFAGSVATVIFFGGWIAVFFQSVLAKEVPTLPSSAVPLTVVATSLFLVKALSLALFENRFDALSILGSNLQLLTTWLLCARLLTTPKIDYLKWFLRGIKIAMPLVFAKALFQRRFIEQGSVEGLMGNPLIFSSVVLVAGFLLLTGLKNEEKNWRYLTLFSFACAIATLMLLVKRSTLLAFIPLFFISGTYLYLIYRPRFVTMLIAAISVVVIIIGGLNIGTHEGKYGSNGFKKVERAVHSILNVIKNPDSESKSPRLIMNSAALDIALENKWLGVGIQNIFRETRAKAKTEYGQQIRGYTHVHNEFLSAMGGSGILGLLLTIGLFAVPIITAWRSVRDSGYLDRLYYSLIISVGFGVLSMTNLFTGHDILLTVFFSAAIVLVVSCEQARNTEPLPENRTLT